MNLIRRIGPLRMMAIKVTALGALFWFAWSFGSYQAIYLQDIGFAASQLGLLNAISFAVTIVGVSFWGMVSDKIRSLKKVLFLILFFGVGFYALIPLIPAGQPYSTALFLIILPFIAFFRGSVATMSENLQVRNCNELNFNYGLSRSAGSLLYTIGSLLAVFLVNRQYLKVTSTFPVSFLLMIPVLILLFFVREPRGRSKKSAQKAEKVSIKVLFKNKKYTTFLVFALLFYTANNCSGAFIPYYMKEINVANTNLGIILAYRAILEIPLLLLMYRFQKKFPLHIMLAAGVCLIMTEGLLFGTVVNSLPGMIMATTFFGLGNGLYIGSSMNYLYQLSPPALRASAQAYFSAVSSIAGIAGNLIGGLMFDKIGAKPAYLVVAGIYLSSVLVITFFNRNKKDGDKNDRQNETLKTALIADEG